MNTRDELIKKAQKMANTNFDEDVQNTLNQAIKNFEEKPTKENAQWISILESSINLKKSLESFRLTKTIPEILSEPIWVYCNNCKKSMNHLIRHSRHYPYDTEDNDGTTWTIGNEEYQLIECAGCNTVALRKISTDYDDFNDETGRVNSSYQYFPKREEGYICPVVDISTLPAKVKNIFSESIDTFNSKNYILSAIGIRSTIEAVCIDKNIEGGMAIRKGQMEFVKQLDGKINCLSEKGYITEKQSDILHGLRFMGNDAAHEIICPTEDELKTAFEIAEFLLKSIYGLEALGEKMKIFRAGRKNVKLDIPETPPANQL